jgi:hypothetical protein
MTTAIERGAERWRIAAIALCAVAMLLWAASLFGSGYGLGGFPRTALWGMQLVPDAPFTFRVTSLDPGGAADRAGIRPGDVIDTRMQSPIARFWILNEPVAWSTVELTLLRDARPLRVVVALGVLDVTRPDILLFFVAMAWTIAFAALMAWRKPESREVRLLSSTLVLLAISHLVVNFSFSAVWMYVVAFIAHNGLQAASVILWALYTGCYARPASSARRGLQWLCVVLAAIAIAIAIAAVIGQLTLRFSSDGYLHLYGGRDETWYIPYDVAVALATVCSALSIFASRGEERQRAVWSLIPLALLFVANAATSYVLGVQSGYAALLFWIASRNLVNFVVPISLTYAALGKRLIDVGFVLNRTLIFGIVSLIVVGTFVLVEWAASEWLASSNRAAPVAASMLVALGLGLSMRFIHHQVDRFVDNVFFRKRHEDEAALRRFAREAPYITDRETLLLRALDEVRLHANASAASILLSDGNGEFAPASGNGESRVTENDRALVALRAFSKPVDLNDLDTALEGEYAYPMMSRGRLIGALVCGPKSDGESYAPDESNALYELAHGVGTALDLLGDRRDETVDGVSRRLDELSRRIDQALRLRG